MKTIGIIISKCLMNFSSKHLNKLIKLGHTGMRCKYWCGEVSNYSTIEKYEGNNFVRIKDELAPIHIDNIEPSLI